MPGYHSEFVHVGGAQNDFPFCTTPFSRIPSQQSGKRRSFHGDCRTLAEETISRVPRLSAMDTASLGDMGYKATPIARSPSLHLYSKPYWDHDRVHRRVLNPQLGASSAPQSSLMWT